MYKITTILKFETDIIANLYKKKHQWTPLGGRWLLLFNNKKNKLSWWDTLMHK